jgi:hypothetical protein
VKAKSLAMAVVLPLATSVALSTAPAASAATPTKAAFSQSADNALFGGKGRVNPGVGPVNPGVGPVNPGVAPVNPGIAPGVAPGPDPFGLDPGCTDDALGFRHGGPECFQLGAVV